MTLDCRLQLPQCLVPVSSRQKSPLSGAAKEKNQFFKSILIPFFAGLEKKVPQWKTRFYLRTEIRSAVFICC